MSDTGYIVAPIVEGDGEVYALPILIRRICREIIGHYDVAVRKPWRLPRGKMANPDELAKAAHVASRSVQQRGGVLVVLDLDDDECPAELAQRIGDKYESDQKLEIVVACREYEAWFLASIESLRRHRSVQDDASYLGPVEKPRDAKGRLEDRMTEKYRETLHQASFTDLLDLTMTADKSRSFLHMVSAVRRLVT